MPSIIYPQLDGVKIKDGQSLPPAVVQAIRKAYDYLSQVSAQSSLSAVVIEDIHANRATLHPAAAQQLGSFYIETDRSEALYVVQQVVQVNQWVLVVGMMQGLLAARPSDLGTNDTGFLYRATNALDYRWSGSAWVTLDTVRGGTSLTTVGAIPKISAAGTLGQSGLVDNGTTVSAAARDIDIVGVYKVSAIQVVGAQLAAVTPPTPLTTSNTVLTAGATYTATEQSMINALKTAVGQLNADIFVLQTSINDLIARLVTHGLTL
jgi:hypothetical protein